MFEQLKEIILKQNKTIDPESITRATLIRKDLGLNSIELAEIVLDLEDKFGTEIDDKAISKLTTIGEIADYLEKNFG
jgi:acyl carrier protein